MAENIQVIARNKKAYHDYFVLETLEAGLALFGTEIKSVRAGRVNLKDAFCSVDDGEMYVIGMHISPYEQGNRFNRDPLRKKKLLLHKREIMKLFGEVQQQGLSIIPLELYIKNGRAKLQIGLCKGKKLYDKRATEAKKTARRTMEREFKERY
ncbi:MAG: SsrA-binding protein SmpB [Eubacterium sp.]|nr:SsrA-binding protein SmpB [Eubacterium sp.]